MNARVLPIVFLVLSLAACVVAPPPPSAEPRMTVVNRTGVTLEKVQYQLCGLSDQTWTSFTMVPLPSGYTIVLSYPEGIACFDLQAVSAQGKVLGTQTNLPAKVPFSWVLFGQ